jgi:hypothetical protein
LSFKFGANIIIIISLGFGSLLTILIPVFARWHYISLLFILFLAGAFHGIFIASTGTFWAFWAPTSERSNMT